MPLWREEPSRDIRTSRTFLTFLHLCARHHQELMGKRNPITNVNHNPGGSVLARTMTLLSLSGTALNYMDVCVKVSMMFLWMLLLLHLSKWDVGFLCHFFSWAAVKWGACSDREPLVLVPGLASDPITGSQQLPLSCFFFNLALWFQLQWSYLGYVADAGLDTGVSVATTRLCASWACCFDT